MIDVKNLKKSVQGRKMLIDSNIIIYLTQETAEIMLSFTNQ